MPSDALIVLNRSVKPHSREVLFPMPRKATLWHSRSQGWHSGQVRGIGHSTAETACKSQGSTSWSASLVMRELLHPKNQIYLTGDTHGQFERIISSCERQQVQPESTFIILGDVGLNYSSMTSAMVWSASCCTSLILKRKRRSWTSGYIESHFNMTRMMKRSC